MASDQVTYSGDPTALVQYVKVMDGTEDSVVPWKIDSQGNGRVTDSGLVMAGTTGRINAGNAAIEAKVGATLLPSRKALLLYNNSAQTIEWSFSAAVTYGTGIPVPSQQCAPLSVGTLPVYIIGPGGSAGLDVRIAEAS